MLAGTQDAWQQASLWAPRAPLWTRGTSLTPPRARIPTPTLSGLQLGKAGGSGEVNWMTSPGPVCFGNTEFSQASRENTGCPWNQV